MVVYADGNKKRRKTPQNIRHDHDPDLAEAVHDGPGPEAHDKPGQGLADTGDGRGRVTAGQLPDQQQKGDIADKRTQAGGELSQPENKKLSVSEKKPILHSQIIPNPGFKCKGASKLPVS